MDGTNNNRAFFSNFLPEAVASTSSGTPRNITSVSNIRNVIFNPTPRGFQPPQALLPVCQLPASHWQQPQLPLMATLTRQVTVPEPPHQPQCEPLNLSLREQLPAATLFNQINQQSSLPVTRLPFKKRFAKPLEPSAIARRDPQRFDLALHYLKLFPQLPNQVNSGAGLYLPGANPAAAAGGVANMADHSDDEVTIVAETIARPRHDYASAAIIGHHYQRPSGEIWQSPPQLFFPAERIAPDSGLDTNLAELSSKISFSEVQVFKYHHLKQTAQLLIDNDLINLPSAIIRQRFSANQLAAAINSEQILNAICHTSDKFHQYMNKISPFLTTTINLNLLTSATNIAKIEQIPGDIRNNTSLKNKHFSEEKSILISADRTNRILFENYMRSAPLYVLMRKSVAHMLTLYGGQHNETTEYLNRMNILINSMYTGPLILGDETKPVDINDELLPYGTRGLSIETLHNLAMGNLPSENLQYIGRLIDLQLANITKNGIIDDAGYKNLSYAALKLLFQPRNEFSTATGYELLDHIKLLMVQGRDGQYKSYQLQNFIKWVREKTAISDYETDSDIVLMLFNINNKGESPFISFVNDVLEVKREKGEINEKLNGFCWTQWRSWRAEKIGLETQPQDRQNADEFSKVAQSDILRVISQFYGDNINFSINNKKMHYTPAGELKPDSVSTKKSITLNNGKMVKDSSLGSEFTANYNDNHSLLRGLIRHFGPKVKQTVDVIEKTARVLEENILAAHPVAGSSGASYSKR